MLSNIRFFPRTHHTGFNANVLQGVQFICFTLTHLIAVCSLFACALALGACSSSKDENLNNDPVLEANPSEPLISVLLEPVATVSVPELLTQPTGITWYAKSTNFVVVTNSGQVATIDGESLTFVASTPSGLDSLADITSIPLVTQIYHS